MASLTVYFLENRVQLGRLAMISTLVPFAVANEPLLLPPMFVAAIFLFLTLNYGVIKRIFQNFESVHYWIKIQYFWLVTGIITASALVYANVTNFIPNSYFVGGLYLIMNAIWFNKINTKMTEGRNRIILKDYTNEKSRSLDFEPYLIPLVLALTVTFTIASLQSLIISRAQNFLVVETLYWSFPLVVLSIYFVIDILFVEQIDWQPFDSKTTWKPVELNIPFPPVDDHNALTSYAARISRLSSPPPGFGEYIEEHLPELVKHAQDLSYLPFQIHYGRAMGNWGKEARDQVHLYVAIILASISQYRFIGLIPLYKRKMFYEMLQVIAMTGSMTQDWRELIEFEVHTKKDEHFVLDWVLGSKYLDLKYDPDWIVSWEGDIYKGKSGYYEAVHKMELVLQIRPEMTTWELDLWDLCREYVRVYIGDEARQVASSNLQFFDQLQYIASKKTSEEYQKEKEEYKESLFHSTNRLVSVASEERPTYTEDEKESLINSYFSSEPFSFTPPSLIEVMKDQVKKWKNNLKALDMVKIRRYLSYFIIFMVNLTIILFMERVFQEDVGSFVIGLEVVLLFFFSIAPSDSQVTISNDVQAMSSVLNTSTLNQNAMSVNNASIGRGLWYFGYGILLFVSYRILAF